ncbi:hypothetical protein K435DRAFT_666107, partial [Dendrothele bispora CBS 962.96]
SVLTFGLVVPCMSQILFIGPIGERVRDIGFEAAFFSCCILYPVLRAIEVRWRGRI